MTLLNSFRILPVLALIPGLTLNAATGSHNPAKPALQKEQKAQVPVPFDSSKPISKADALNLAIAQNGDILQAQKQMEAEYGISIAVKAIVFPHLLNSESYAAQQKTLNQITGQNNQVWNVDILLTQSIYEGGRLLSALRSSHLIKEKAALVFESTVADTLLAVSTAYDDVLRDSEIVEVRNAQVKLLTEYLALTEERFKNGVINQFEVLRAQVELTNAKALQQQASGDYLVSKQKLVEQLGYNLPATTSDRITLHLTTHLAAKTYPFNLEESLLTSVEKRTEIAALSKEIALRGNAVIDASAGYKPSLQAFAGYQVDSPSYLHSNDAFAGGMVGAQVSWPIFDGFLTKGKVDEAVAQQGRARAAKDETSRIVQLQVRSAWSRLHTAQSILTAQAENITKATEALRLSQVRYKEGTGTQIDVFSSETSLTEARGQYVQALRDYSVAYSQLLRATGRDLAGNNR